MDSQIIDFLVSVPGKVILYGEHSVVYGKTALAASVNLKTCLNFTNAKTEIPSIILDLPCVNFNHDFPIKDLEAFLKKNDVPLLSSKPRQTFSLNCPDLIDFDKHLDNVKLLLESQKLSVSKPQESAILSFFCLFWAMLYSVDVPLPSCHIKITSELDIGSGMGSSSSYNISLAAAFLQYIRHRKLQAFSDPCEISKQGFKSFKYWSTDIQKFEKSELDLISRWGHFGDKIMHGNPSGIDNAVCTYGSVIEFRKGTHAPDIKVIPDPKFLKILLVNTKIPRDTKKLVNNVASLKDRLACVVEPILQAMDSVALSAAAVLRRISQMSVNYDPPNSVALEETLSGEISKLEELIDVNQKLLEALGVSHDTLEEICRIAKAEGLHGKLTGAGGGGYAFVMLPFHDSDKQLCALKMNYERLHLSFQQVTLGGPGVTLEDRSTYTAMQRSDSSFILSTENFPAPKISDEITMSPTDNEDHNAKVKDEELDEWPWPFDLREVVKNMFENHIKEDLQAGEISVPLKSLCAVNVPNPLPQWMDKINKFETEIAPVWRNVLQSHIWKGETQCLDETGNSLFGPDSDIPDDILMQEWGKESQLKSHRSSASSFVPQLPFGKDRMTKQKVSVNLNPVDFDSKVKPAADVHYHIPKQTAFREGLCAKMNNPTKWLKDQFLPYGKREWAFGINLDENVKHLKSLQKKHKKFLKHQKSGCEYMNEA